MLCFQFAFKNNPKKSLSSGCLKDNCWEETVAFLLIDKLTSWLQRVAISAKQLLASHLLSLSDGSVQLMSNKHLERPVENSSLSEPRAQSVTSPPSDKKIHVLGSSLIECQKQRETIFSSHLNRQDTLAFSLAQRELYHTKL
jgi:hypothetical protein